MSGVDAIDWTAAADDLDAQGWTLLPGLLSEPECDATAAAYDAADGFRSHVSMARHGYGRGEYRYFAHPLPPLVERLRTALYAGLAPLADRWHARMGMPARFPPRHADYLATCHAAGQRRPTPLLLRYGPGDHNRLHRDLYGAHVFPMQATALLSRPGEDFTGGDFVLTEQRPRMQSRVEVVALGKGDAVVFAVADRPCRGTRGDHRVTHRHGVATVRRGQRTTLGIIFHDAA